MQIPSTASQGIDGTDFVTLEKLIELKLASGISAADRLKDLADVQELIKIKKLDAAFAEKLDPYVRPNSYSCNHQSYRMTQIRSKNEHTKQRT